jgi:DNA invertase Pin-like site-specific DNA recombinase
MQRRVALYCRVSTAKKDGKGQTTANQELVLREVAARRGWQIVHVYADEGISGVKGRDKRPGYDALLKAATRHEFDLIAAWSVDRLGRSLRGLVEFLDELRALKVDLFLNQQGLDTTTPTGRAMFGMASIFAEWERSMIQERIMAGIARARIKGTKSGEPIGRKPISSAKERAIIESLNAGHGICKTARLVGVGNGTVEKVRKMQQGPPREG